MNFYCHKIYRNQVQVGYTCVVCTSMCARKNTLSWALFDAPVELYFLRACTSNTPLYEQRKTIKPINSFLFLAALAIVFTCGLFVMWMCGSLLSTVGYGRGCTVCRKLFFTYQMVSEWENYTHAFTVLPFYATAFFYDLQTDTENAHRSHIAHRQRHTHDEYLRIYIAFVR